MSNLINHSRSDGLSAKRAPPFSLHYITLHVCGSHYGVKSKTVNNGEEKIERTDKWKAIKSLPFSA